MLNPPRRTCSSTGSLWWGAALLLALVCSLASFAGQWHWAADLLSHFRLHFVWGAGILSGLALLRRRSRLAAVFGLLALVHLWDASFLYRKAVPAPALVTEAEAAASPLRLMSFNAWLLNTDGWRLRERVLRENPDVLFIAEMSDALLESMDSLRDRYPYQFPEPGQNWIGLGMFSRYPWRDAGRFPMGGSPNGKMVLKATLATPGGPLTVVGVHTTSPMSSSRWRDRNLQLDQLAQFVSALPGPVVVVGDYNATPWSPAYRRYLAGTGFHILEPRALPVLTWPQWVPAPLRIPIDNMTASRGIVVARKWSGEDLGSDHRAVVAEVRLTGPEGGPPHPEGPGQVVR